MTAHNRNGAGRLIPMRRVIRSEMTFEQWKEHRNEIVRLSRKRRE